MERKFFILSFLFAQICLMTYCQSPCIIKNGKIVYECGHSFDDSTFKANYAELGNNFIRFSQRLNKSYLIYLCLDGNSSDTIPRFELAYDNLKGNSVENNLYKRNRKFDKPGIRIKIYSNKYHPTEFLRLLGYGLTNVKKLRKMRKDVMSLDLNFNPESISLTQEEIKIILSNTQNN
jgi:hypothetical protein